MNGFYYVSFVLIPEILAGCGMGLVVRWLVRSARQDHARKQAGR